MYVNNKQDRNRIVKWTPHFFQRSMVFFTALSVKQPTDDIRTELLALLEQSVGHCDLYAISCNLASVPKNIFVSVSFPDSIIDNPHPL